VGAGSQALTAVKAGGPKGLHDARMNPRRILIVQGHPDPAGGHLCHALADTYLQAATAAGHEVRQVDVARLDFPLLRSQLDWEKGKVPLALAPAQQDILWANHLVLFFPLWLGDMPALLKGFLEQVARPGFAFKPGANGPFGAKGLAGRSARVVVTMGMPALVYRYIYRAHSIRSLERNVLGFVGMAPVHETLIGNIETKDVAVQSGWFVKLSRLGAAGD
jgi:putative NADPH-quinone reductase